MSTEKSEKPLDKMTVKELREVAKEIPEITGVHGMNKAELLDAVMKARGIEEIPKAKSKVKAKKTERSAKALKKAIKAYRKKQAQAAKTDDKRTAAIYRRKISRLKKKTRKAA
jgi:DNA-binding ferritin-like protein